MGRPLHGHGLPQPQRLHSRASTPNAVQCDGQRRPAEALPRTDRRPPGTGPVSDPGQEGEHEVELLLNRKEVRGVTHYLVRWRGHSSAADEWLRADELIHCPEKVAEYDAAAPRRRAALKGRGRALPDPPAHPSRSPQPRSWRQRGFGWHCWESYAVGRRWLALGCCISGQLTVGCRDGCAARAGGQAFHTWWATLRRHRSGQRRWTRCWTRLRTAPPAVGNFSYLWAVGPGAALDSCGACADPLLPIMCRARRSGELSFRP